MQPLKHFYVDAALTAGATVTLPADLRRRLTGVLRMGAGAEIALFNGRDGLWQATLTDAKAKQTKVGAQLKPQPENTRGLILVLGLPKREAWETALRQATELGVVAIQPLITHYAQRDKFNAARAKSLLIEAAEQCERLTLPTLHAPVVLTAWLETLNASCAWAYERGGEASIKNVVNSVLVGPEGGFSPTEVALLSAHPQVKTMSLGPTILRTDTAVVAALVRIKE
jgi:16S rRNA (uracil1498-N3)-methyltransferase